MGGLFQVGVLAGLSAAIVLVLRAITVLVVVVWSLRANEAVASTPLRCFEC